MPIINILVGSDLDSHLKNEVQDPLFLKRQNKLGTKGGKEKIGATG